MKWTTKARIQRFMEILPAGRTVYGLGQRWVGSLRHFTIQEKVREALRLLRSLNRLDRSLDGLAAVEIGTGWAPVAPLLFWLTGQRSCETFDLRRLLSERLTQQSASQLLAYCDAGRFVNEKSARVHAERLDVLRELVARNGAAAEILDAADIRYHAPADAGATALRDASVDVVFSLTVLEHVPPEGILRLFRESFRILRGGGLMMHIIDPADHYAQSDPSISILNFLQFSEKDFARYNNSFSYQNRLRAPAYRELVIQAGFEILHWSCRVESPTTEAFSTIRVHPDFARFSKEEICSLGVRVLAVKP